MTVPLLAPSVALIVLNWNGRSDTLRCLASFDAVTYPGLQVVLVDNGSTDGTVAAVAEHHPSVEIIALTSNTGFCAGNNAGLSWALDRGFDVVGVLNNDTVVDADFLDPLIAELGRDDLAVVSPRIVYLDRPAQAWFGASRIDAEVGIVYHRDEADLTPQQLAAPVRGVPAVTGCCLLAARSLWLQVGLFDERFFLIFEDADWSARARAVGAHAEVVVASTVHHAVSSSFASTSSSVADYYYARNGLLYLRDHGMSPRRQSVRFLARLYRQSLALAVRGHDRAGLDRLVAQTAGVVDFVAGRSGIRRHRADAASPVRS